MVTTGQCGRSTSIVRFAHAHPSSESLLELAQSRFLVSGSADNELRLWNVSNGKCLYVWEFPTAVKRVVFSDDDERVVCITEQRMGHQGAVRVFRLNRDGDGTERSSFFLQWHNITTRRSSVTVTESREPEHMFNPIGSKATVCAFTYTPNIILTGHESGKVALFDAVSGTEIANNERAHMDTVTDLQLSLDRTYFVTSSKDKTARVSRPIIRFFFQHSRRFAHPYGSPSYTIPKLYACSRHILPRHRSTARHSHQTSHMCARTIFLCVPIFKET